MRSGVSSVFSKTRTILQMIKFEHSVFALPFAYMGAFLAADGMPGLSEIFWITLAMVGARSFAMSVNRLIDKEIDGRNPRTKNRALPRGILRESEVLLFILVSFSVFILSIWQLAPLTRKLWPLVVIPFIVYPYTKRFTWSSHFLLGLCLGLAPVGAWVAIRDGVALLPFLLGGAVLFWVAGFDIVYACQDLEVDKGQKLFSMPANFGIHKALRVTAFLHVLTVLLLLVVGVLAHAGLFFLLGVVAVAALLAYENRLVSPNDLSKVNEAFFTTNGFISVLMFLFTATDYFWRG